MRKHSNPPENSSSSDEDALIQNIIGLGEFSARKSYYPELLGKIDELELEKERYKWLFENALHGIFQAQIDGGIATANPAIAKICGYSSAQHIQQEVRDLGQQLFVEPQDYQQLLQRLQQDGFCRNFETQLRKCKGDTVWVSINCLLKEQGLLEVFAQDITARKLAQDKLTQLNEELEQRVKYRTATLNHTNERLNQALSELLETKDKLVESEKMAALGELVAGVAHEINTPVGTSITSISLIIDLLNELDQQVESDQLTHQGLDDVTRNIGQAADLIFTNLNRTAELIRSFKQIAVNQNSESAQLFNVSKNLHQTLLAMKPELERTGCEVSIECDDSLEIYSYPASFIEIYKNLIMNSVLHGFDEERANKIQVTIERHDDQLKIIYRDNGLGIPEPIMHKLFDPFVTDRRGRGGSGLGTHIIYNLVTRLLQGTIRCESERGVGTQFEIKMPLITR